MNLHNLFRRADRDRDRADEMQAHIDHATAHYIDRGYSPDDARREARLRFGNPRAHREVVDDLNRLPLADTLARDLRYAVRMIRRARAFSATVVLTLAVCIGATSAVFAVADAVLIRALPYPDPDRLAVIAMRQQSPANLFTNDSTDGAMWETVRERVTTLDAAVGIDGATGVNFVSGPTASFVRAQRVGTGFFRVLGVPPFIGREFTPEEDRPGGPALAILAYDFWARTFSSRREALGETILLRGEPYQVVGVMPKGFRSTADADVWTPLRPSTRGEGGGTNYMLIARVRDGHTWDEASAELGALGSEPFRLFTPKPDITRTLFARPMQDVLAQDARQPILILFSSVIVVLIIACVNVAVLIVARGAGRAREIATRMALGSGRAAVIRQLMVESVVLAAVGGGLGLFIAALGLQGLRTLGGSLFGDLSGVSLDWRTVAVTAGLSLLTSVVFGLVPALQGSRINIQTTLIDGGSRGIAGGRRHHLRRVLVVAEVALGVMLLVGAGLLVRQFANLKSLDPGFTPDRLFTASVSLQDARYPSPADINRLFDRTLERLQQTPGVTGASVSQGVPYQRLLNMGFRVDGEPAPDQAPITNVSYVTTGYFSTFGIPLVAGRVIEARDVSTAPLVAVVNRLFARIYFPQRHPVGLRLVLGGRPVEIVGVVGDVQQFGSGFSLPGMANGPIHPSPTIYVPAAQTTMGLFSWFSPYWTVRAASAGVATAAIREAVSAVDPLMPIGNVQSMAEISSRATARPHMMMWLVGLFAVAAALLSAIGLHGLIAQSVSERTRELGIRLALGALPGATLRSTSLSGIGLAAIGIVLGGALSFPATSLVASFLVDVPRRDAPTYVAVTLLILVVTSIATIAPALRILRLDPAKTLRE